MHKQRNILNKVRPRDKQAIAHDSKEIFNNFDSNSTLEEAKVKLDKFCSTWQKSYPHLVKSLQTEDISDYFTYTQYPVAVRRTLYTTNSIEHAK